MARVLHLANSPYFGQSGNVANLERAVVVLGASTLRSLGVSTAAGMMGAKAADVPEGFWRHSAGVATGAAISARLARVPVGDAMCAGLLHDLGAALVYRFDRAGCIARDAQGLEWPEHLADEWACYGQDHAAIGALALQAWKLPATIVEAVRVHHQSPLDVGGKLGRCVIAGEAPAGRRPFGAEPAPDPEEALAALGLEGVSIDELAARTAEDTAALEALLAPR